MKLSFIRNTATLLLALLVGVPHLFAQTFNYTGDLRHDRSYHTATLLTAGPNAGKVLIAGGLNNDKDTINAAELYDPASGAFATTGNLQHDRAYHTATLLSDGATVLLTGGRNGDGTTINSAEIYNSSTGAFSLVGNLQHDRQFHTATLLASGQVLIAAGQSGTSNGSTNTLHTLNNAELYNTDSKTFSVTGSLQHDRAYQTATLLTSGANSGKVLIAAGLNNDKTTINAAELYNPTNGTFTAIANLQHDRAYHTATLLQDGATVLIAGGRNADGTTINSAEIYTSSTGTFASVGNLQHDRQFHTATLLTNGQVLLAAGQSGTSNGSTNSLHTLNLAELYNPTNKKFATTGNLRHDRTNHTATALSNGHVLISAGRNNDGSTLSVAELY